MTIDPADRGPMFVFVVLIVLMGVVIGFVVFGATAALSQEIAHTDDDRAGITNKVAKHASRARRSHSVRAGRDAVLLPHPPGCPRRAFCGCGASVEIFGKPVRSLWPSSAWFKFPRTSPAPNMVAVRRGHVFVLKRHVEGNVWLAADFNSGGRKSRLHHRSIAGYAVVNPHGSRMAGVQ